MGDLKPTLSFAVNLGLASEEMAKEYKRLDAQKEAESAYTPGARGPSRFVPPPIPGFDVHRPESIPLTREHFQRPLGDVFASLVWCRYPADLDLLRDSRPENWHERTGNAEETAKDDQLATNDQLAINEHAIKELAAKDTPKDVPEVSTF